MTERSGLRKVALLTGAGGFVGKHLARALVREGWSVHALMRSDSAMPEWQEFSSIVFHNGSDDTDALAKIIESVGPTVVFHLASLFVAEHSSTDVEPMIRSNILFGVKVLEAMSVVGCNRLVNTGTAWQRFDGADYDPATLYAATKQAFEDIARYYVRAHGFSVITLRLYDTYGPGDVRSKLVSLLERTAKTGDTLKMSPGEQKLYLVHVDDVVEAYKTAAQRLIDGCTGVEEVFEVRAGSATSLREVVMIYQRETGQMLNVQWGGRPYRSREVMNPGAQGRTLPGWEPKVSLVEGFRQLRSKTALD